MESNNNMDRGLLPRPLKKSLIDFFGNIKIYSGGIVFFGQQGYGLTGPDWREILNLIQPGDIVLNAHYHYVSSFFIKGEFGHAGLYVGDNQIIHVIGDGIIKEDILTFLRADAAAVIRPKNQDLVPKAIENAYEQFSKHVQYDYDFNKIDNSQFYCTEFTDFCYGYIVRDGVAKDHPYIYPDDYLIPSDLFEIIWRKER